MKVTKNIFKPIALLFCSLLILPASCSKQANPFEARTKLLLEHFATTNVDTNPKQYSKYAFWYAQALFYSGAEEKARSIVDLAHQRIFEDYSFYYWGAIDTYLRWKHLYTEAQKIKAKELLLAADIYDTGKTENNRIMLAVTRFLASEQWPDEVFAGNYSTKDPTAQTLRYKASPHK